ncbi:hypothetical protein ACFXGA_39780 [Actinosynnema sp. NPDC059335]|uniref:hypothetical protein n=1 Tax=Actinosynnema sp. NPDC059335 TaxID=3346804 RepID=UPI00366B1568
MEVMEAGDQPGGQPPRPDGPSDLQPDDQGATAVDRPGEPSDAMDIDTFDAYGFDESVLDSLDQESGDSEAGQRAALAERLERTMQEFDLIETLRAANFTGPRYEALTADLAAYGLNVTDSWIRRRIIYAKSAQRGRPVHCEDFVREHLATAADDRSSLAGEIVAHALVFFGDYALRREKWSPLGGAGLRTFFIGACVAVFANVFRAWHKEFRNALKAQPCGVGGERDDIPLQILDHSNGSDPGDLVVSEQWVSGHLAKIAKENLRHALDAIARRGATYAEIGQELGMPSATVKMMVVRYRKEQVRRRANRGRP